MNINKNINKNEDNKLAMIVSLVCVIIAVVIFAMALKFDSKYMAKKSACTVSATASIYDMTDDMDKYILAIKYNVANKEHTSKYDITDEFSKSDYKIGQKVEIKYNPDNVTEYYIPELESSESKAYILFAISLCVGFLGCMLLFFSKKERID